MAKPVKHYGRWRIRWLDETGKRRSASFDDFKEAMHQLRLHETEVEDVKRGLRSPTPPPKTFSELADYWIARRVPTKRSGHHDESIIRAHLRPFFGDVQLKQIDVALTDQFVCERLHLNKKTQANHLSLLLSMLNVAIGDDLRKARRFDRGHRDRLSA